MIALTKVLNAITNFFKWILGLEKKEPQIKTVLDITKETYILTPDGDIFKIVHYAGNESFVLKFKNISEDIWERQPTSISPGRLQLKSPELSKVKQLCEMNFGSYSVSY